MLPVFELPVVLDELHKIQHDKITEQWQLKYTLLKERLDTFKDNELNEEMNKIEACSHKVLPD